VPTILFAIQLGLQSHDGLRPGVFLGSRHLAREVPSWQRRLETDKLSDEGIEEQGLVDCRTSSITLEDVVEVGQVKGELSCC